MVVCGVVEVEQFRDLGSAVRFFVLENDFGREEG